MKLGKWEIEKYEKDSFEMFAPKTYWQASPEEIGRKAGGCGPGEIGDWLVPDDFLGDPVRPPCEVHDWMYGEGETEEDKKWADLLLLINLVLAVIRDPGKLDFARLRMAMDYYEAVHFGGKDAFEKGKTPKQSEL
jgi:hypothetical protein